MFESLFPSHWTTLKKLMWLKLKGASAVWSTISGNPVSFTAKAAPLKQLSVAFSPVQEGSGDPSPDNVRPISGWSSLTVEQRGKNLLQLTGRRIVTTGTWGRTTPRDFSEPSAFIGISMDGYFYNGYIAEYSITGDSVAVNTSTGGFGVGLSSEVEPNTQYTVGYDNKQTAYMGIGFYDADGAHMSYHSIDSPTKWTFTTPADCKYIVVVFRPQTYNELISYAKPMLVKGDTMPTYVPYNGRSISINLGSTVYSGTVDVVTGVGEVTMAKIVLDGTQAISVANWRPIGDSVGWLYAYSETNNKVYPDLLEVPNIKSDQLKTISYNTIFSNSDATVSAVSYNAEPTYAFGLAVRMTDATLTTKELINAYLHDSPITVVYELATPLTIQLTPQEVESLAGDNTMWTDAASLEVTYRSN